MTGDAYQHAVLGLLTAGHAYWLASGVTPIDETICRAMAHNAIQAAAHALNLEYHHRQAACPDHVAALAYKRVANRWRASVQRVIKGLDDTEALQFQVMLERQERSEDLLTGVKA